MLNIDHENSSRYRKTDGGGVVVVRHEDGYIHCHGPDYLAISDALDAAGIENELQTSSTSPVRFLDVRIWPDDHNDAQFAEVCDALERHGGMSVSGFDAVYDSHWDGPLVTYVRFHSGPPRNPGASYVLVVEYYGQYSGTWFFGSARALNLARKTARQFGLKSWTVPSDGSTVPTGFALEKYDRRVVAELRGAGYTVDELTFTPAGVGDDEGDGADADSMGTGTGSRAGAEDDGVIRALSPDMSIRNAAPYPGDPDDARTERSARLRIVAPVAFAAHSISSRIAGGLGFRIRPHQADAFGGAALELTEVALRPKFDVATELGGDWETELDEVLDELADQVAAMRKDPRRRKVAVAQVRDWIGAGRISNDGLDVLAAIDGAAATMLMLGGSVDGARELLGVARKQVVAERLAMPR